MTSQGTVLLSTAGPYAKIGTPVVDACVESNTHYCDLTGEAPWIRSVIDDHEIEAQARKLKIVNCCGFDCIPSDLGAQMIVEEIQKRGAVAHEVRFTAHDVDGGASGGTIYSMMNMFATNSFKTLKALSNPFFLNPRDKVTNRPVEPSTDPALLNTAQDKTVCDYDSQLKCWTIPYIMQAIDTRIVNRSNALSNFKYGPHFVFTERMKVPNALVAAVVTLAMPVMLLFFLNPLGRALLGLVLPTPGQGPSQHLLDHGYMKMRLWGKGVDRDGQTITVTGGVTALHGDPGYRQTAKMIAETAVSLALDRDTLPLTYGVLTPASALGGVLRERLNKRGVEFFLDAAEEKKGK
eukprot:gene22746-28904_t